MNIKRFFSEKLLFKPSFKHLVLILLSLIWFFFASSYARRGDLYFHSDVARDYLVMEEIVSTRRPTLIGPRAGGVSGYFHGPLWFYLNLPAFVLTQGNPEIMAWWYVTLVGVNILIVYVVATHLFSKKVGRLSVGLFALIALLYPINMFNPYGAVLISSVFFWAWCRYDQTNNVKFLIASIFFIGILIQFQIAFGGPMLVLVLLAVLNKLRMTRQWPHLFSFIVLLIPLSTYLVFDIRHDWLQLKALWSVVKSGGVEAGGSFFQILAQRVQLMVGPSSTLTSYMYSTGFVVKVINIISILLIAVSWKNNEGKEKRVIGWFVYFYLGFWIVSLVFPGDFPNYYYWAITPIATIVATAGFKKIRSGYAMLFSMLVILNIWVDVQLVKQVNGFVGERDLSWKFYEKIARDTFSEGDDMFGYFVYTPDLYAYQPTYAMSLMGRQMSKKKGLYFQKQPQTFLIIAPVPNDRPMFNADSWKRDQVKIAKEPINVIRYSNGYRVEEYNLSEGEIKIEPDPNIVKGLFFR